MGLKNDNSCAIISMRQCFYAHAGSSSSLSEKHGWRVVGGMMG